ncbi:MAG: FAD-dependent oxidoreductase [Desulfobacterales bacterium]
MSTENKSILVIGGGIAGLTSAWELSRFGYNVELIEKTCFLGGHGIQFCCKATDECVQCGACSVEDMLKKVVEAPNITIHLATEVESIHRNGTFSVKLKKSSLQTADSEQGIIQGIIKGYSKNNRPLYVVVDPQKADHIPEDAVNVKNLGTDGRLEADAVILASGFEPFRAEIKSTYGYGRFKNVITGMDLERLKRNYGRVVRPSDEKPPERIAFIQCVGSRDERLGNLWCSQVCCPYAMRMARDVKYNNQEAKITIFYMDIQNAGKNFPEFYAKCKSEMKFVRTIPVDVFPLENDRLKMRYLDEPNGTPVEDEFDLIVLSIGITPGPDNRALAELLGLSLNKDGFVASTDSLNRTTTAANGVFMAGTIEGPKTIAASIAHAGHAAREVMKFLGVSK